MKLVRNQIPREEYLKYVYFPLALKTWVKHSNLLYFVIFHNNEILNQFDLHLCRWGRTYRYNFVINVIIQNFSYSQNVKIKMSLNVVWTVSLVLSPFFVSSYVCWVIWCRPKLESCSRRKTLRKNVTSRRKFEVKVNGQSVFLAWGIKFPNCFFFSSENRKSLVSTTIRFFDCEDGPVIVLIKTYKILQKFCRYGFPS